MKRKPTAIAVEISRPSSDLERAGYEPFEQNPAWSERAIRVEIGYWLEMLGVPRRYGHGCKLLSEPDFIEFDSGNPSHACGYWQVMVEFSPAARKIIERASEGEPA